MSKVKFIILLTVFIDVIGIGVVIPILPFYVAQFSDSALLITSLFAVFALCSFLSAPVLGALSDRIGRRPLLIGSILSTAIGWFVFAGATNIFFLFVGRILDGIMAGNFPLAQSFLTDIAKTEKERTENLGLIGAVFGIGFIFGPLLGGVLGQFGHSVPFWFVGGLALANAILAFFILPETHHERSTEKVSLNPFVPIARAVRNRPLRENYLAWFLFGLAIAGFQSIFSLYMRDAFHFDELVGGFVFGAVGILIALNQGFMMKRFWLKYFKEPALELVMLLVFAVGFLLLGVPVLWVFALAILLTTFGHSILRVVMTGQIVAQSPPSARGETLGIVSSVTSLSMMIGPVLSGALYEKNIIAPFFFGALLLLAAFALLSKKRKFLQTKIGGEF